MFTSSTLETRFDDLDAPLGVMHFDELSKGDKVMPTTIATTTNTVADKCDGAAQAAVKGDALDAEELSEVTKAQIEWHRRNNPDQRSVVPLGRDVKRLDAAEYKGMTEPTIAYAEWHRRQYPGPGDAA